jgi:integrase
LLFAELDKCRNWIVPVLVRFALETGARRGEILSLRWKDIDLTQCTARLDGKTGARVIPLSALAVTLLQNLPRSLSGKVFSIPVRSLRQAFERAVARARLGDFVFHDLRHCALTRIARHHQHHAFQQSRRTATDTRLGGTDSD